MEKVKEIAKVLKIVPKLRVFIKKGGAAPESTGPHIVKFIEEPTVVMGKDDAGQPRKEMRFLVEENGLQFRWNVPIMSKDNQPSYLIERLMDVNVGDDRVIEGIRSRGRNYIDVRKVDEAPEEPEELEGEHPAEESHA